MRVRDLGSLVVAVDTHEQIVRGRVAPALLARLAVSVNERVSSDALTDAVWGDRGTRRSESTLVSHIWRLRQMMEPDRGRWERPSILVSEPGGFRLVGAPSTVDSLAFAESVTEVGDLLAAGQAGSAVQRADTALTLWRGDPYGEYADASWAQPAVARLVELHGQVQESRIKALLALGDLDRALSALTPLISAVPLRETLRALQMEALHRDGRTEEALQAYRELRTALIDELGIEPNTVLRELHRRILNNEKIGPPGVERVTVLPARAPEVHLPRFVTPLIGRADVLAQLSSIVPESVLVTVVGAAGSGKTRLTVDVAGAVAEQFPDGVWFVDFTAVSDPDLAVDVVISTIGFNPSAGATPLEDLRSYVQGRRLLLVLDNCEHLLTAVAVMAQFCLGAGSSSTFLATSREPLDVDGEIVWALPPLGLPDPEDPRGYLDAPAVQLFLQRLHAAAPTVAVDERLTARIADICVAVDGLPLALELAAARASSHSIEDVARQVEADPSRLARVGRTVQDHRVTLRSAIEWSHRLLTPQQQAVHRRLAVLSGPFTANLAAAVAADAGGESGEPVIDTLDVDDILSQLVHRSLLSSDGQAESSRPTAFRQLATVRSHAHHALSAAQETALRRDRRDAWTIDLLSARPPLGSAAEAGWYQAIDDNYAAVRSTLARHLIDEPNVLGARLATRLSFYWYYRQKLVEASRWLQLGRDTLTEAESSDALLTELALASALLVQYRSDLARPSVAASLERLERDVPARLIETGEALVGLATAAYIPQANDVVADAHRHLERIAQLTGSPHLRLLSDAVGCTVLLVQGHVEEAAAAADTVYHRACAEDSPMAAWVAASPPMVIALMTGRPADGVPWVDRVIAQHYRLGPGACGMFLENRAIFSAQAGDYTEAVRLYAAARAQTRRAAMIWPRRPLTDELLESAKTHVEQQAFEEAWRAGENVSMEALAGSVRPDAAHPAV